MGGKTPTFKLRIMTDLQYYSDGTCAVIRSYNIPDKKIKVKPPKKEIPTATQQQEEYEV